MLEIEESGTIYATLAEQPRVPLQNVCYQDTLPHFNNAGGGPFLRGWMRCDLETADVKRGRPSKLWLELKLRQNVLNGSLVAFSQRELYIGPLSHWVELMKDRRLNLQKDSVTNHLTTRSLSCLKNIKRSYYRSIHFLGLEAKARNLK